MAPALPTSSTYLTPPQPSYVFSCSCSAYSSLLAIHCSSLRLIPTFLLHLPCSCSSSFRITLPSHLPSALSLTLFKCLCNMAFSDSILCHMIWATPNTVFYHSEPPSLSLSFYGGYFSQKLCFDFSLYLFCLLL